jgi:hypothetical protein
MHKALKRSFRDNAFYYYISGYLDCNPSATKSEAIRKFQERHNDDRHMTNLHDLYNTMLKELSTYNINP